RCLRGGEPHRRSLLDVARHPYQVVVPMHRSGTSSTRVLRTIRLVQLLSTNRSLPSSNRVSEVKAYVDALKSWGGPPHFVRARRPVSRYAVCPRLVVVSCR